MIPAKVTKVQSEPPNDTEDSDFDAPLSTLIFQCKQQGMRCTGFFYSLIRNLYLEYWFLLIFHFCDIMVHSLFSTVPAKHKEIEVTISKESTLVEAQSDETKSQQKHVIPTKEYTKSKKGKTSLKSIVSKGIALAVIAFIVFLYTRFSRNMLFYRPKQMSFRCSTSF